MKSARQYRMDELKDELKKLTSMSDEAYDIKKIESRVRELERGGFLRRLFTPDPDSFHY